MLQSLYQQFRKPDIVPNNITDIKCINENMVTESGLYLYLKFSGLEPIRYNLYTKSKQHESYLQS